MAKKKSLKILIILSVILLLLTSVVKATELSSTPEDSTLLVSAEPSDTLIASQDESLIAPNEEGTIDVIYEEDTESISTVPEIVSHDVYVTEKEYVLAGNEHINGNVFIMANKVTINGVISGNVFILGNDVSINSPCRIEKSLFIAANTINFNGGYLFDIYATANKINFTTNAYSIRDVKFAANTIKLAGYFGRNLDLSANTIYPDLEDLKVQNNFSYSAPEPIKNVQLNVEGDVKYTPTEKNEAKNVIIEKLTFTLGFFVFSLIVACLLIFVLKRFTNKSAKIISVDALKPFVYGLLAAISVPILLLIALILLFLGGLIPVIAIPLITISIFIACITGAIAFCLLAVLIISNIIVSVAIARKLKGEDKKATFLFSALFILALLVLELIPIVGKIVVFITWIFATGIIILSLLNKKDNSSEKVEYGKEELEEIKAEEKEKKAEKKVKETEKKEVKKTNTKTEKKTTKK